MRIRRPPTSKCATSPWPTASFVIQHDLSFSVKKGDIFIIMGGSGCGKSTLLRHLVGLKEPAKGYVLYDNVSFWDSGPAKKEAIMRRFGVLYQGGALWSSMTLAENVALPLGEYTNLSPAQIKELVSLKLSLVGLAGFEEFYPSEISGGMRKRAGLARAMALDPDILFFDEPSAARWSTCRRRSGRGGLIGGAEIRSEPRPRRSRSASRRSAASCCPARSSRRRRRSVCPRRLRQGVELQPQAVLAQLLARLNEVRAT